MAQEPNSYITNIIDNQTGRVITAEELTAAFEFITTVLTGDDAGINLSGELVVGSTGAGKELVVGEGDSYPIPLAYHCTITNTDGLTITDAVDITTILQSDAGSSTGVFNGEAVGNYILAGSDTTFGGVKVKISTPGVVEAGYAIGERLADATPTWVASKYMSTNANFPYDHYGTELASTVGSEQWRFGFDPENLPSDWDKVTLNINGEDITKYWARFRIGTEITLDPIIEQIKLHTNRWECNADGVTEYFGIARYPRTIPIFQSSNADKTPVSENVSIAPGITETRTNNEFADGKNDGFILRGTIPVGMDTSIPVYVLVDWYPTAVDAGNVELQLDIISITEGFVYDGTATPVSLEPITTTITVDDQYKRFQTIFKIDTSNSQPNQLVYGSLYRDATSGNTNDTYGGNIVICDYRVVGWFWKP